MVFALLLSGNAFSKHKITFQMYKDYKYGSDGSENYQKLETKLQNSKLSKFVKKPSRFLLCDTQATRHLLYCLFSKSGTSTKVPAGY